MTLKFAALGKCLSSYASEQGSMVLPTSYFVPREAVPPLSNEFQEGRRFLPVQPWGSSDHAACSWSRKSTPELQKHNPGDSLDF